MKEVLVTLFIVVVCALLVFLAIKVAKKDILMTRIAVVLSVLWLFFFNFIVRSINYFSLEKFVLCLFPLVLFWGFVWIANAWIEKRGSNE